MALSDIHHEVRAFVDDFARERGHGPSIREIAAALSRSATRIHQVVAELLAAGLLEREGRKPRTLRARR